MTTSNSGAFRVDESIRRANNRAISRRARWRAQYRTLSNLVRAAKIAMCQNPLAPEPKMVASALRMQANDMMIERDMIRVALKQTSFKYQ